MDNAASSQTFKINAGHLEIDVASMPTVFNSTWPNRVWLDGAGTATGATKGGILRVGPVSDGADSDGTVNNQLQCFNNLATYTNTTAFTQHA